MAKFFKAFLTLIVLVLTSQHLSAYDFSIVNSDGVTIYYNVTSHSEPYTVAVTYKSSKYSASYSGNVNIPSSVIFSGNTYSVDSIGEYAFYNSKDLTSVTIPEPITSIGDHSFGNCSGLTSLTLPNSITSIGYCTFVNCTGLTAFYGKYASEDNRCLIVDGVLATFAPSGLTSYVIPEGVSSIGDHAFNGCSGLTSVTIPNSVTSIDNYAFQQCSGLKSLTIPEKVTSIGKWAFCNCSGLSSINIPESVTSIEEATFYACSRLTSVSISKSVTSIGNYAFQSCSSLTYVAIPDSVTSIGDSAFQSCSSLTSINFGNSCPSIGKDAFIFTSLKAFYGKYASEDNRCLIADNTLHAFAPSGLSSYTIPNSITSIGDYAFSYCSLLTINIPNSVTSIGEGAFFSCKSLTDVTIPDSVISLGKYVFYACDALTSVTIGNSVTSIGESAFFICQNLKTVTIGESVISIGKEAFSNCYSLTSVNIPNSVTSIGNGAFAHCTSLTDVTILGSVSSVGESAFYGCTNLKAFYGKYASEDNRCWIADGALILFAGSGITNYTIPNSVTSIGASVFAYCTALTSVTIPETVTSIGDKAFESCRGLTSVIIPNLVTTIGDYAFEDCSELTSVTIGKSVNSIGIESFNYCYNLKKVVNYSYLDIVKGSETHGYVAYYADEVIESIKAKYVSLNKTILTLTLGGTETLIATIQPADTFDKTVTWTSSDEAVATIDSEGLVTAIAIGTTTITATCGKVSATCDVTVNPIPAESVTLNKTSVELKVGNSEIIVATVLPEETTFKTVTWTSSDENVATVDENGCVMGVCVGTATITATCGSVSATCEVTVSPIPAESVKLSVESIELKEGESVKILATVYPEETTFKTIEWSSSNAAVATVDNDGKVMAVSEGSATITAACGEVYATCIITVTAESGIENIKADGNGRYIVWNMQGTKILDTENAKEIKYLPEGFYIINGTKVLLK